MHIQLLLPPWTQTSMNNFFFKLLTGESVVGGRSNVGHGPICFGTRSSMVAFHDLDYCSRSKDQASFFQGNNANDLLDFLTSRSLGLC